MEVVEPLAVKQVPMKESEASNCETRDFEVVDILGNGLVTKKVIEKGLGQDSRPNYGDSAVISYKGWLEDGSLVEEAEHLAIVIGDGECIHAFDLALPLAELKELFELKTDSRFAYGDLGNIMSGFNSKASLHIWLYRRNEFQYALTCYTKAVEILMKKSEEPVTPSSESFPPCTPAQLLDLEIKLRNNVAATQLKLEAFAAAAKTCDIVLHLDPTNRKALYRKGQASSPIATLLLAFTGKL
ncbi:unnamed protein product [Mesocestoides corti]|uniref:peptidylprolyl isomerase n=1 Tax=Mesocestoides corti TaxID=53468 RepID=A0A0R3URM0_MESCO|nr:unnamed protein product [Mesocestoides corti]